jgi:hypothetical protein
MFLARCAPRCSSGTSVLTNSTVRSLSARSSSPGSKRTAPPHGHSGIRARRSLYVRVTVQRAQERNPPPMVIQSTTKQILLPLRTHRSSINPQDNGRAPQPHPEPRPKLEQYSHLHPNTSIPHQRHHRRCSLDHPPTPRLRCQLEPHPTDYESENPNPLPLGSLRLRSTEHVL